MKGIILKLTLLLNFAFTYAQISKIIPPTPNVASIAKYGNLPFGLFTGQPKVSFDLYEISYPDFKFPITLSYNYSGLKVEEYPGWVGSGWTLHATGYITRQIRGLPDEQREGYNGRFKNGQKIVDFINNGANKSDPSNYELLKDIKDYRVDPEPDIFYLSAPGLSCQFFFDEKQCNTNIKEATVFPDQSIIVKGYFDYSIFWANTSGFITKFEVTNEEGIMYTFELIKIDDVEVLKYDKDNSSPSIDGYGNMWHLTEINTPFGNKINFQYKYKVVDQPPTVYEELLIPENFQSSPRFYSHSSVEAVLEAISFRNGTINFIESESPRSDWGSQYWKYSKKQATNDDMPRALEQISISQNSNVIREYLFKYTYNPRLMLDSFQEINGTDKKPSYNFEYEAGNAPTIGDETSLFQQDHWGYYTGTNHKTLLTPFFADVTTDNGTVSFETEGNFRIPNHNAARIGLLKKITYPTGGYTQYYYEPNNFFTTTPVSFVPTIDKTMLGEASASIKIVKEVDETKTITITEKTFAYVEFTANISNCGEAVAYVELKKKPYNITIMSYNRGDGVSSGPKAGELFILQPGEYEIYALASRESTCSKQNKDITASSASIKLYAYGVSGTAGSCLAGGFRVRQVDDCTSGNCITKTFDYTTPGTTNSSGVLINSPIYAREVSLRNIINGQLVTSNGIYLYGGSLIPLATESSGVIGYKYVTDSVGTTNSTGKTVHKFTAADDYPDNVFYSFPIKPRIDNSHKRGMELENKKYSKDSDLITEEKNEYTTLQTYSSTIGLSVGCLAINLSNVGNNLLIGEMSDVQDRAYEGYNLVSSSFKPIHSSTTSYSNGNSVNLSTDFFYDNPKHNLLTRTTTTDSKNELITTTISYSDDVANLTGLSQDEVKGIQAMPNRTIPIEQKIQKGQQLISTHRYLYEGAKFIKSVEKFNAGEFQEVSVIEQYDPYGNINQYRTRKERVTIVYGYESTRAIAEVKNATLNEIFHTSFEEDGNSSDGDSRAGRYSKIDGYIKTLTNLTPNKPYVLSYWKKNTENEWIPHVLQVASSTESSYKIELAGQVDEIRFYPQGAQMTTYTYDPAGGILSASDANNLPACYQYDKLGRLIRIIDQDKNLIKEFRYYYERD